MPMVSVRAIYEQGEIKLLEPPPVQDRYEVLVTFLAPEPARTIGTRPTLKELKGIWSGLDISLEEIQASEYQASGEPL